MNYTKVICLKCGKGREVPTYTLKYSRGRFCSRACSASYNTKRKLNLDESVFDVITEASAYWAGFLMADGCIIDSKPQHRVVVLDLKYGDIAHVESFKNFLKSGHKITKVFKKKTYNAKIQVGSERLATVLLQRYGIGPRKSFTAQVSGELALNRHFWRGVIDGDGHIKLCKHRQSMMPKFELVGSRALLTQFLDFAQFNGLITIASPKLNKDKNIWRLALSGNGIGRIIAMLYANASTVLARKAITAAAITTHTDPIEIEKRRLNSCNAGFTTASKKTPEQRKIEMARISAIRWATAR